MKILTILTFFTLTFLSFNCFSQELNKASTKRYLAAEELYVFKSDINDYEFNSYSGERLVFLDLVKKYFSDKEIIEIDVDAYDELDDVDEKYCLSIQDYSMSDSNGSYYISFTAVFLQRGRSKYNPNRMIAYMMLNIDELVNGIGVERLEYAIMNLDYHLRNFDDESRRSKDKFKCPDFEEFYENNVVLIREDQLDPKIASEEILKEIAPLDFKIISQAEWNGAVTTSQEDVLFADVIACGRYYAVNIHSAKTGKLVTSFFPIIGYKSKVGWVPFNKTNIRKIFD